MGFPFVGCFFQRAGKDEEMTQAEKLAIDLVYPFLALTDEYDIRDRVFWRCGGCYGLVTFCILCNDLFAWGTADLVEVTAESLPELRKAIGDVLVIQEDAVDEALDLFCARTRRTRPQGAAYPKDKSLWALFDACGPERAEGVPGNPYKPGEYRC